jgi:hypothetical protein
VRFPRSDLISILPDNQRELDRYSLKVSVGLTGRAGNTESADLTAYALLQREDHISKVALESTSSLGTVNQERTSQNWNGRLQLDLAVSKRVFFTPAYVAGQHNYFQNIDLRALAGSGGGIKAVDTRDVTSQFGVLAGYQYSSFLQVTPPEESARNDLVVGVSASVDWDVLSDVDFELSWRTFFVPTHMGQTYHNGRAALSIDITDFIDLDVAATFNRIEEPTANSDGTIPDSNDLTTTVGIGFELE